jgi:hypothetical protein
LATPGWSAATTNTQPARSSSTSATKDEERVTAAVHRHLALLRSEDRGDA